MTHGKCSKTQNARGARKSSLQHLFLRLLTVFEHGGRVFVLITIKTLFPCFFSLDTDNKPGWLTGIMV